MADAKLTALTAASALAAADLFYVSQSAASRKATGTQLLALVGTTYVPLAGGTMTGALTIASGTLTASAPALNDHADVECAGVGTLLRPADERDEHGKQRAAGSLHLQVATSASIFALELTVPARA
jgi:hypothetical protein